MRKKVHYIYQCDGWPAFTWDMEKINSMLNDIIAAKGFMLGQMSLAGFEVQDFSYMENVSHSIVRSAEIEGEKINLQDVRSSVARKLGINIADRKYDGRNTDGLAEMMLDAINNCDAPLTENRLFGWHGCLFSSRYSGPFKIRTAQYRDDSQDPMQVVSDAMGREKVHYQAPDAGLVPRYMEDLLSYVNDGRDNPIIKAAVVHLWFATIHPFEDGNGRMARAVCDMLLARSDKSERYFYTMSSQILKERKAYYSALETAQHGSLEITAWMEWFMQCLGRCLENSSLSARKTILKHSLFDKEELNARQRKMIGMLFDGFKGHLTSSKWAKINRVSQMTASRDISELLQKGILTKQGSGRSTHYTLL